MKKKLNLNDLKVKSFITGFDKENVETVKGGRPPKSNDCGVDDPEPPNMSDFLNCYSYRFWCF